MKNFKFLLLLLFLLQSHLTASQINFFVKYDIMTFSTFKELINFNSGHNIEQYIQYNSIIPIFLSWEKPEALNSIKNLSAQKKINFFQYKVPAQSNEQLNWFLDIKEKTKQRLFGKLFNTSPIVLKKNKNILNILNFIELKKILTILQKKKFHSNMDFNLEPSLFLFNEIGNYFNIIKNIKSRINFFIFSDKEYTASQKDINKFIDMLYYIKTNKTLSSSEKKIYRLALLSFIYKIQDNLNNIILTLFPLTSSLPKKYFISSMDFNINKKSFITLYDKKNYIIFDKKNSNIKKFFYLKKGISLINDDSLVDELYTKKLREPHYKKINLNKQKYFKFDNGMSFIFTTPDKKIRMEKNIILQYNRLIVTYKIKNLYSRKRSFTFIIKNKLSPSLLLTLENLKNPFAVYYPPKQYGFSLDNRASGIINTLTGYGIAFSAVNKPQGLEVFKNFYNYSYNIYYKFNLYPFETKTITLYIKKIYLKNIKHSNTSLKNSYWGKYEIK